MGFKIEVDVMCIMLLVWIVSRLLREKDERMSQKYFKTLVYALIATCVTDICCTAINGREGHARFVLNQVFTIAFLGVMSFTSYMWLVYSTTFTRTKKLITNDNKLAYRLPWLGLFGLILSSPWSGIIFMTDSKTNINGPGFLDVLVYLIPYFYIIAAAVQLLIAFVYDPETKTVLSPETIVIFIVLPIIALVGNLILNTSATTVPALTLVLAAICFDLQVGQISTDGLTGLNNKRQYLQYIQSCLNEPKSALRVYLFMIDIDYFKYINDEFGHSEGDKALIEVAELLKSVCSGSRGMFLARYGGDEFVFVIKSRFADEVAELKNDILKAISERNTRTTTKYKISLSIGYSVFENEGDTLEALTSRADDMLYAEKQLHHAELDGENE